ncbi:MAG: hypothetical protein KC964_31355 [Candidatus Omnitrophica bacterium]|nr:hypothetical protein [Candidatus Omnitrophota bacterium]
MNAKVEKTVEQIKTFTPKEREEFLEWLAEDERKRAAMEVLKKKLDEALKDEPTEWTREDLEDIRREGKALAEKRRATRA